MTDGPPGLTLDSGALIALDRPRLGTPALAWIQRTLADRRKICIPTPVIAQAWRSERQVRLARLIKHPEVEIVDLDVHSARAIGLLCARSGHHDVVDAHVALCAMTRRHAVLTSDPDDLAKFSPALPIIGI